MASKTNSRRPKNSKKFEAFNRSQQIYKLLEKGIIESDALLSSTGDRPEEDAHVSDLLQVATSRHYPISLEKRRGLGRKNRKVARRKKR